MNHLVSAFDLGRVESSLLERKKQLVQETSMLFNWILLALVLGGFAYFLYVQYNATAIAEQEQEKRIPFEPQVWYSATRNVRSEEYGRQLQPYEVETRYGLLVIFLLKKPRNAFKKSWLHLLLRKSPHRKKHLKRRNRSGRWLKL
jgi:hypothetical protein